MMPNAVQNPSPDEWKLTPPAANVQPARGVFFDRHGGEMRIRQPNMSDTHGGGMLEDVPGFAKARARLGGLPYAAQVPPRVHHIAANGRFETFLGGGDPIVRVTDTTAIPWRSVAYLALTFENGQTGFATGWFAAANTVITAGHCFFDAGQKVAVTSVSVVPGYDGQTEPFQSHAVTSVFVPPEWKSSVEAGAPDSRFDYALGYLSDAGVGDTVGWFGLAAPPDSSLPNLQVNISGYPANETPFGQYYDGGRLSSYDQYYLYHQLDTYNGMSGSPIIVRRDDRRYVIGIHSLGTAQYNRARRIDDQLFDELSGKLR